MVRPDHGENFVPGSESAPDDQAPQPLDHFKRGYKERAELRDREMGHLNVDFRHKGGRKRERSGDANEDHWQNSSHGRREDSGGRGDRETGTSGPSNNGPAGLDVTRLVAKLDMPGCDLNAELDQAREEYATSFDSGKAMTAILANLARRRKLGVALSVWQWMDQRSIPRNVFHFNSLISVCEKMKDWQRALKLLDQMEKEGVEKNEVTFSSAISSCEKSGQWRTAIDLLQRMKKEGIGRTAIAYNAAISACEKVSYLPYTQDLQFLVQHMYVTSHDVYSLLSIVRRIFTVSQRIWFQGSRSREGTRNL
jgi:pentatricopeptide repeat protein